MPKITFLTANGKSVVVNNAEGTLMEVALDNAIDGISGNCGGVCSCSTCHVKIPTEWGAKVGQPDELEQDTLDFNPSATPNSRLSCQIEVTDDLDGLVVEVAPED